MHIIHTVVQQNNIIGLVIQTTLKYKKYKRYTGTVEFRYKHAKLEQ